jgi:hypothetical protein
MHSDFLELLLLLEKHKVKYLLIGGYAVGIYAEPRATKDLDVWVDASLENGRRLLKALKSFGAPTDNLSEKDIQIPGLLYIFGIPPLRVDILNRVGKEVFKEAYKKRHIVQIGKVKVSVVPKEVLKKMKKAAGRPQDKADLKKLQ